MDKRTPPKSTQPINIVKSPELPLTLPAQQHQQSQSHDTREIQETPARPKPAAPHHTDGVMHDTKGQYLDPDIDDGDLADSEDVVEGDASLYRSFGKIMRDNSQDEKAQGREETESETENVDYIIAHGMDDVEVAEAKSNAEEEKKKGILKKEKNAKEREKTPEEEDLPEVVPETPQPERKKRKMDYD